MTRLLLSLLFALVCLAFPFTSARSSIQDSINLADWDVRVPEDLKPGQLNYFSFTRPEGLRFFYLYVPTNYDASKSWPFTFYFHGYQGFYGQGISLNMTMDAENAGYLIAFGQGTPATTGQLAWNAGVCCKFPNSTSMPVDDVMFTRIALKTVQSAANVDASRVYATGWSNGGFMTERLACEAPELFAGICADASAVGIEPGNQGGLANCDKSFGNSHLNYIQFHATADTVVPWTGNPGAGVVNTLDDTARWVQRMGCSGKLMQTYNDGTFSNLVWPECRGNATIEFMTARNQGHQWWTKQQGNFDTMAYVMAFFDRTHKNSLLAKTENSPSKLSTVKQSLIKKLSTRGKI